MFLRVTVHVPSMARTSWVLISLLVLSSPSRQNGLRPSLLNRTSSSIPKLDCSSSSSKLEWDLAIWEWENIGMNQGNMGMSTKTVAFVPYHGCLVFIFFKLLLYFGHIRSLNEVAPLEVSIF